LSELEVLTRDSRARAYKILKFSKNEEDRGLELHRKLVVCDSLLSPPYITPYSNNMKKRAQEMVASGKPSREIDEEMYKLRFYEIVQDTKTKSEYIELQKMTGVTCASETVAINDTFEDVIKRLSLCKYKIDRLKDFELLATCVDDIKRAKREQKFAYLWNLQDSVSIGGGIDVEKELGNINTLFSLGIRVIQLTYNLRNFVGEGCTERYGSGLSYFGIKFVERMNKLGMLVDISHCGHGTTMDAVEVSKTPVAATHTICKSIYPHDRGKTDEELKSIADKDGYVGICQLPQFLGGKGTINEFLNHIDHATKLIGVNHVGIGTDTWYRSNEPQNLVKLRIDEREKGTGIGDWWGGFRRGEPLSSIEYTSDMNPDEITKGSLTRINWPYFTVGLVTRGYSDQEIQKIIGGNFMRILEKTIG
jgi:membrane dipeptidase